MANRGKWVSHSEATQTKGNRMKKYLVPAGAAMAALGIVGGVAATQAFQPVAHPRTVVQLVQPAAQTVTVTPSPTTTTTAPVKTATVAPKPAVTSTTVKPAPVQSTQAVAPAPRTVQKAAVVSTDPGTSNTPAPAPAPAQTAPGEIAPPLKPAIDPGQPTSGGGVYGGGAPSPSPSK